MPLGVAAGEGRVPLGVARGWRPPLSSRLQGSVLEPVLSSGELGNVWGKTQNLVPQSEAQRGSGPRWPPSAGQRFRAEERTLTCCAGNATLAQGLHKS